MARALAADPHAVDVRITTEIAAWRGAPDELQVRRAVALGGVLISHNHRQRRQFRTFVEAERAGRSAHPLADPAASSVLLLPRDTSNTRLLLRTTMLLDWYLTLLLPKPPTLLWHDAQEALRGGWRPADYSDTDVRVALGHLPPPP